MGGGGKGGSKKVTVGYRYSWDILAGLGRGPVNELVAITADKKTVFAGTEGQISHSTRIYIDKPGLFGGEDTGGEGGIQGTLDIQFGNPEQMPLPALSSIITGLYSALRGHVTTFFSGLVSCYSASPKPWQYRVRRYTAGWSGPVWYPEKALIKLSAPNATVDTSLPAVVQENLRTIHAMNAAHILVECALNLDWGRRLTLADIDIVSYRQAADTLFDEGFGLCFRYNRQDDLNAFVQQVLDHISAAQYGDLATGKLTLKLIRDDYDVDALPLFTYDNGILDVQDDDSTSTDTAPNEIIVRYRDPVTNTDAEVRAQNLGAIQTVGLISSVVEYPAIPTHDLGARVAQRDLESGSAGITRLMIKFDRRGGVLAPASVFRVSLPDRGIEQMVLRVGDIREQTDGSFLITAVQDVFGLPATNYSGGQQGGGWTPPDTTAKPVTQSQLLELPYSALAGTLSAADLDYLTDDACFIGVLAAPPTQTSINYQMQTRAAGSSFNDSVLGDWAPFTTLILPINTVLSTQIWVNVGTLLTVGEAVLIDAELMRVDSYDPLTGLLEVGRGCVDTLPALHSAGAIVWRVNEADSDLRQYMASETVDVRLLTQTRDEILPAEQAPILSLTMNQRQARPYLPGLITVNDALYPAVVTSADEFVMTWAHRDRLLQADQLIDCQVVSIGPEPGVSYLVSLTNDETGESVWSTTLTTTSVSVPYTASSADTDAVHILTLSSSRGGLTSFNEFRTQLPAGSYTPPVPPPEPEPESTQEPTEVSDG